MSCPRYAGCSAAFNERTNFFGTTMPFLLPAWIGLISFAARRLLFVPISSRSMWSRTSFFLDAVSQKTNVIAPIHVGDYQSSHAPECLPGL